MKKTLIMLSFAFSLSACSSIPEETFTRANDNAIISDAYVVLMEQGRTNRAQDQSFIRANRRSWHAQNYALNNVDPPADVRSSMTTNSPLDKNLVQSLDNDAKVRAKKKELEDRLNNGNR